MRDNPASRQKHRLISIALVVMSSTVLAIHSYLGSFARFLADDFCSVYFARRLHTLRYIWYWYLNWGGRYSAIGVDSFIRFIGSTGVRFVPVLVIMIWAAITSTAFHQILQKELGGRPAPVLSLALGVITLVAILTITPQPQQILYWWNGMRTYVPALILFTFHIGFLYWSMERLDTRGKHLAAILFSFMIVFTNGGFNETFTAVQLLFYAGIATLGILTKKLRFTDPVFSLLAAGTIASLLSLFIMWVAPGTANRQGYFTAAPNLTTLLVVAIKGTGDYLLSIVRSMESLLALLSLALVCVWIGMQAENKSSNGWMILLILGAGLFLSFASLVPAAYAFSEMPAPRTYSVPAFTLVASFVFAGLMLGKWLATHTNIIHSASGTNGFVSILLLSTLLSTWINSQSLYTSRDIYSNFAQRWDAVDAKVKQAISSGDRSVQIPAVKNWAGLEEPNDNPKFWVTQCYSLYYGIQVLGPNPDVPQP